MTPTLAADRQNIKVTAATAPRAGNLCRVLCIRPRNGRCDVDACACLRRRCTVPVFLHRTPSAATARCSGRSCRRTWGCAVDTAGRTPCSAAMAYQPRPAAYASASEASLRRTSDAPDEGREVPRHRGCLTLAAVSRLFHMRAKSHCIRPPVRATRGQPPYVGALRHPQPAATPKAIASRSPGARPAAPPTAAISVAFLG